MEERMIDQELDLQELLRMLLNRWYLIVLSVVIILSAVSFYAFGMLNDVYTANTSMIVLVQNDMQSDAINFQLGQRLVDTYTELATSDQVISRVLNELNLPYSESRVRSMMSVSGVRDTIVIKLSVTTSNPSEAAAIANTLTRVMQEVSAQYEGFDSIEILDVARVPSSPSGPNRPLYLAIGLVLGLMIGVFSVFAIEFFDRSIKTTKDIEQKLKLRVLGVIPDYDLPKEGDLRG